ncbi:unnamed protein product [Angiostrongylus costaricensis]|uniref:Secreted protein n=1 Tax=Angiostrongylus costaricensis TaxID=334426 RepID=A0A0R3PIT8_ANGCS|nr:unnamed protein product [Angiostrongylus costaricensis]
MLRHAIFLLMLSYALQIYASPYKVKDKVTFTPSERLENSENSIVVDKSVDGNQSNLGSDWPDGEYCIMPGPSLRCPAGFQMDFVSLAVPMNFGLRELYTDRGKEVPYIELGRFGGLNLELREYDQAYILRLTACCKSS